MNVALLEGTSRSTRSGFLAATAIALFTKCLVPGASLHCHEREMRATDSRTIQLLAEIAKRTTTHAVPTMRD